MWAVHKALSEISPMFSIAAAFGNVHGVYKPGNVVLSPQLLDGHQKFIKEKLASKLVSILLEKLFLKRGNFGILGQWPPSEWYVGQQLSDNSKKIVQMLLSFPKLNIVHSVFSPFFQEKPTFLVMHGGSGSTEEEIRTAVSNGAIKMNVDTDTQWAYWDGLRGFYEKNKGYLQGQVSSN